MRLLRWLGFYPEETCHDEVHRQCVKAYREAARYLDEQQVPLDPPGPKGSSLLKRVAWLMTQWRREKEAARLLTSKMAACAMAAVGNEPGLEEGSEAWSPTFEEIKALALETRRLREARELAVLERNLALAALSKLFPAWLGRQAGEKAWENEQGTQVIIELPTGQVAWPIDDHDVDLFTHLKAEGRPLDRESSGEKYARLHRLPFSPAITRLLDVALATFPIPTEKEAERETA